MKEEKKKKEKKKKGSGLRLFFKILLGLLIFLILLILFIRSPWGQNIIVDKLVNYISNKTNTVVEVDRLFITFGGDVSLEGLYMEDKEGDTLIYSRSLEADIPLLPIIQGKGFRINSLDWEGGRANIKRQDTINGFNFQFLMDAFATADTTATTPAADTTAAPMEFYLGDIDVKDLRLNYDDAYLGIDTYVNLGRLMVEMQEFDLDSMQFAAGDALLENTEFRYAQTKPAPPSEDEEEVPMPQFSIENLKVQQVKGIYESVPDGLLADVDIEKLNLDLPKADLEETSLIVDRLDLSNSRFAIHTSTTEDPQPDAVSQASETEGFQWPEWQVQTQNFELQNIFFEYLVNGKTPAKNSFDPEAVVINNLNLDLPAFTLANQKLEANVQKLNFEEASGLFLRESNFALLVTEEQMRLRDLLVQLNGNYIEGNLVVDYKSLDQFIETPEEATVDLNLPTFNLDLQEIYRFQPDLRQNEYFATLAKKGVSGALSAEGKLSAVKINNANINWGSNTSLAANGTIFNATDPDALRFDLPRVRFESSGGDLRAFVEEDSLGIQLPENLSLRGRFSGTPENITADAVLESSAGKIDVNGRFTSAPGLAFNADLKVTKLQVGQILQNKSLGPVTLNVQASGSGEDLNSLDAIVEGTIDTLTYNNYKFENIVLEAQLEDGEGYANLDYKDKNLNMELESFVQLDSIAPEIALNLNIIGADLQALGLSVNPVNTAMEIKGNFKGNVDNFDATAAVTDGIFVYANESYLLGDVDVLAHVRPDTTSLAIQNRMLDLRLFSNTDPTNFINALNRHYESYFTTVENIDTVANPVNVDLRAQVSPSPILEEVFLPSLEAFDTINVQVDFREREKTLVGSVSLPFIKAYGSEIDSLQFDLNSNPEELVFDFGLESLKAGPLAIHETSIEGRLVNEELDFSFISNYEGEPLMALNSTITRNDGVVRVHLEQDSLVLNSKPWQIAPENEILIGDNFYTFNNFRLSRENQQLRISNEVPQVQKEHIGIQFQNFNLAAIFAYLNPEEQLTSGNMNGNFIIEEPFGNTGWVADLVVNDFHVMEVPLGVLSFDANAVGMDTYNYELTVKEGNADIDIVGTYVADEGGGNLDMNVDLNRVDMELIEGFSMGAITNTSGNFSGSFSVMGEPLKPDYEGNLHFSEAGFTVAILNAPFTLPDENLRIDNSGVYMEDFDIRDSNGNSLVLNGAVLTETLLNPDFDLSFSANNFTALNSTAEDFDLFYGKAVFDATGSVTGNLELPQIELDLEVLEETNITYVIPEANLEIEEREGVVIFVNREDPDRILTRRSEEDEGGAFSGFALNSYISVQEGATFKIILDEETGDHFQASGDGDLLYDIYPNGRTTLSGRMEINDGYYEMSLYNLVTRRFDIMEGSTVVWAGDPMDADLDITAVYNVEASASGLMAAQITSQPMGDQDQYRQELDFMVYLRIGGEISAPKLSFGLDMPEDEQGALSGQVYGRVQQINQQENELNKQVFSLLVLNRFFPSTGSAGTEGGTLSFARDNLNEALSDQLNIFSDRLMGETGIDLNFGLNSFTDYQGENPQDRTQLDITAQRSFLDERLIVSVGSEVDVQGSSPVEEANPLIGKVSLDYLLTPDGRFRLQAFRRNSYENIIEGQVIISGLALIFTQEFNQFRELWNEVFNPNAGKEEVNTKE